MIYFTLKELIDRKEKTQTWLAEKTGVRYATINTIATNRAKEISIEVINRICCALHCMPGDFMSYQETEQERRNRMFGEIPAMTKKEREELVQQAIGFGALGGTDLSEDVEFTNLLNELAKGNISADEAVTIIADQAVPK